MTPMTYADSLIVMACRLKLASLALPNSSRNWHEEWELTNWLKKGATPPLNSFDYSNLETDLIISFQDQRVIGKLLPDSEFKYGLVLETKASYNKASPFELPLNLISPSKEFHEYAKARLATLLVESGLVI